MNRFFLNSAIAIALVSTILSACAIETKRPDEINTASASPANETAPAEPAKPSTLAEENELKVILSKTPKTAAVAHSERHPGKISADQAWSWLRNGNTRFRKGFVRKDGITSKDRVKLASGQTPHSIVLSCSDSRVPPEVIFDQKLGEIFVIRTAGQSADYSVIASIEYAIEHLGSNLIVVMGHESCGAVKATLSAIKSGQSVGSPALDALVANIKPRVENFSRMPSSEGYITEGWGNVTGTAKDLMLKSIIIRRAVESGDVKIASALYHLGSGEVEWKTNQ